MKQDYTDFLDAKLCRAQPVGFEPAELNSGLFEWQADLVRWFCRIGRAACFADTGLGKTLIQLAWAEQVCRHTGGKVLVFTPLAVAQQTAREAEKFGIESSVSVCREQSEATTDIVVANYERLHKFDSSAFAGVVLDESSILKSYTGKTKGRLVQLFRETAYRLACTATPAPNDHMELGNHSEFLGIMPSNEMLSRWFINDSMKCGAYRLRHHGKDDFWRWVTSWAACVSMPSDLGYDNGDFELPPLNRTVHEVSADNCPVPSGYLFHCQEVSATNMHSIKRATTDARAEKVKELVGGWEPPWIVWCDTNYEADAVRKLLPEAVDIRGSDSVAVKEERLLGFSGGKILGLITKPEIAGHGLNWQHCNQMVFMGLSFSFERMYQAVRRCWRFGQKEPVNVHVVTTDAESSVMRTVDRKAAAFTEMRADMAEAVREGQLESIYGKHTLQEAPEVKETSEGNWTVLRGDCVEAARTVASDTVGLSVFSPPFSNLYIYSDSIADMGNSVDDAEFFEHFGHLIPELLRITIPGRLCCVHCKDLPLYYNRDGVAGLKDFPGEIIRHFQSAGWTYHSRVTIWKDPVIEMQRTKNNGLLHKTLCRDSSQVRQGMADYVVAFRKPADGSLMSAEPVDRKRSRVECFDRYVGSDEEVKPSAWAKAGEPDRNGDGYGLEVWQRYASPVWFDIDQTRVLNYRQAKSESDEKHICPLQLDVIERCIELWSKPGDLVFSPFAGIGSEGYCAILSDRRFLGAELKDGYVASAVKHLRSATEEAKVRNGLLF